MDKIDFDIGSEEDFFYFIDNLKGDIALISHNDLDGMTCAKIVNEALDLELIKFVDYEEINFDLVKELKERGFERVIFSDLKINDIEVVQKIEKFA